VTLAVTGRFRFNHLSAVLAAARASLGIAALPWCVADDSLASGHVADGLKGHRLPEQEIPAVYSLPKLVFGKVQAFIAFLSGRFGASGQHQR
jgi:DNA-binding transcriptional LysR family regulator